MKKELYIHIPKPCQEDWQQMTPVTNGRYCDSCAKQVVDFSTMSDVEVLNFLSRSTGKLCGRFSTDQLQRPLQPTKEEPRKSLWLAAFMPLLLLFDRSSAQRKATEKTPTTISPVDQNQALMGKVLPPDHSKDVHKSKEKTMSPHPQIKKEKFTEMNMVLGDIGFKPFTEQKPANTLLKQQAEKIKGFVKDANSHPVANAFVQVKGTGHFANTDSAGYFEIPAAQLNNDATLNISCIGYIAKDWPVIHDDYTTQNILLEEKVSNLPEVTVTSFESTTCRRLVVGITSVIVQRIKNDTIPTLIRKAIGHAPFRVFPNPAKAGAAIKVDLLQKGSYSIQLFSGQSALVAAETVEATQGATIHSFVLPASMAAGIYYIRVVNEQTKKQYTDKILVQ